MDGLFDYLYETPAAQPQQPQPQMTQYFAHPEGGAFVRPEPVRRRKEKKHRGGIVALALVCSLLGGAVGAGAVALATPKQSTMQTAQSASAVSASALVSSRESAELELVQVDNSRELTPAEVYAKNVNSTVGITTEIQTTNYWGYRTTAAASGSGFLITADGYILTNYHVIEDASTITVSMYDGTSYTAQLVGFDESNDIAVLKIDATGLTPVILGSSDALNVGDTVMAIGNPLGELTFSLTTGVVSALDRDITLSSGTTMSLIQTDAAINSGNSGGALFNSYGEVVGITNAKYSSSGSVSEAEIDNIGFAIPIDSVLKIVSSIMENGYYAHPYLGISLSDADSESGVKGALIAEVVAGSPAQAAGLTAGDIVTSYNGKTIASASDLIDAVAGSEVGETVALSVYRNGEAQILLVTIGEKQQTTQQSSSSEQTDPWGGWSGEGGWGSFGGFNR